jgi:hypothetical protein
MSVTVHLKHGTPVKIDAGVAVAAATFPAIPGNTPAPALQVVTADGKVLAVFRQAEVGGYSIEP